MAATIKLMRVGKKKHPFYRLIVIEKRKKPTSNYIDKIGFYNPHNQEKKIIINKEKLNYWLSKGVKIANGVAKILKKSHS